MAVLGEVQGDIFTPTGPWRVLDGSFLGRRAGTAGAAVNQQTGFYPTGIVVH